MSNEENAKRGEVYMADLGKNQGSVQNGMRPVLIVSNDIGNKYSSTVLIAIITSKRLNRVKMMPTHVIVLQGEGGLQSDSVIACEQLCTLDKLQLDWRTGKLTRAKMKEVDYKLMLSLGISL